MIPTEQPPDRFVQRTAAISLAVGANLGLVLLFVMLRSTDPDAGTKAAVLATIVGGAWAALATVASNRRSSPSSSSPSGAPEPNPGDGGPENTPT